MQKIREIRKLRYEAKMAGIYAMIIFVLCAVMLVTVFIGTISGRIPNYDGAAAMGVTAALSFVGCWLQVVADKRKRQLENEAAARRARRERRKQNA